MKWPTWEQSAIAAAISGLIVLGIRKFRPGRGGFVEPLAVEFALISALYAIWRVARKLPLAHNDGAIERARQIVSIQEALFFPTELSLQHFVLRYDWLGWFTTLYYATMHVPSLIAFLIWLFARHRDHFAHWRNGLVLLTAGSLFIRFIRVAPPRFLVDLGYTDLSEKFGPSIYGPVGTGVSDQFAAMPSIHVGWAAVVSFGIVAASTSKWRWVFALHVIITMLAVSATGNHWWLDGIVAIALLIAGLAIDSKVRSWFGAQRVDTTAPASDVSQGLDAHTNEAKLATQGSSSSGSGSSTNS